MSDCNMSSVNFGRADLRKANLGNAMLKHAILPVWNNGLLEGVRITGATVWMPARSADLSGANLSNTNSADLSGANLLNTNMKSANLTNVKLHNA
jgi:uncharacterized protein YjbI with pentapeptide repeats